MEKLNKGNFSEMTVSIISCGDTMGRAREQEKEKEKGKGEGKLPSV